MRWQYGEPNPRAKRVFEWTPHFAFLPVRTIDRKLVWWEWVEKTDYFNYEVRVSAPHSFAGNSFRIPEAA